MMLFRIILSAVLFLLVGRVTPANATHSWGNYHWARTANPFTLNLGDNVSTSWDTYLATASADWSFSSVLDTMIVEGGTSVRRCRPTKGKVEVCNYRYGNNGWLGLAQIWVTGDHITQGVAKVNDTYFTTATYNTPAWKNLVMCQEVGHNLGLDHQDEDFNNPPLYTCMDYTSDPTPNQHPNRHDYEQLELIYAHLDGFTTVSQSSASFAPQDVGENAREWGKQIRNNGHVAVFERDFGNGQKVLTHVIWAEEK